ncbi:MAG: carboxypeptidase regulatory-like domain-containing protein, partial [Elusimicrobiales bacterium]|nr:carboxypeptidase regulatory-like domain-containing protein [Elusimicrobiales bacterium]
VTVNGGAADDMYPEAVFYDRHAKKTYVTGIDGSVYDIKILTKDMAVDENSIELLVKRGNDSEPMAYMSVAVVGFDTTTMMPDTDITFIDDTDSQGRLYIHMPRGREYLIGISTPNWGPTIRDQMMDPYGNFNIHLWGDEYREYYMWDIPEGMNTLSIHVSSISAGELLMADVFFASGNREMISSGITISTDTEVTMDIYNVPESWGATYGVRVFQPGEQIEYSAYLSNFPTVSSLSVDMSSALPPSANYDATTSTNPPSYEGFVQDNLGNPIENAKVTVMREEWTNDNGGYYKRLEEYETYTDPGGKFAFYDLQNIDMANFECIWPAGAEGKKHYSTHIKKLGYSSTGDCFRVDADYPWFNSYHLQEATYTLTGQIQFNGVPVPFARVDIWGMWEQQAGADSYGAGAWDAGMKSDAHVKTDASGNFEVEGLTDGNININTSFWSTGKEYNSGPDGQQGNGDDLRVTISSDVAQTGGMLSTTVCDEPGAVWIIDAVGNCIS